MKRPYQITGAFFIVVSAFLLREALRLKYYTPIGPGPGFFPVWVSVALLAMGAIMLYRATFQTSEAMAEDFVPSRSGLLRMGAIVLALVASIVLMGPVGFRLTTLGSLLFLLLALGRHHPVVTGLVALAGSFGTYQVFAEWLEVPLPIGMFGI